MRKLYIAAATYLGLGLAAGVFYREWARFFDAVEFAVEFEREAADLERGSSRTYSCISITFSRHSGLMWSGSMRSTSA